MKGKLPNRRDKYCSGLVARNGGHCEIGKRRKFHVLRFPMKEFSRDGGVEESQLIIHVYCGVKGMW
jgi:hypothetical protein